MSHAEKVKELASNLAFEFATEFDPQKGEDESASYHKTERLLHAAIDEMHAEIDRLTLALSPRKWTRAHSDAWHKHLPDMYAAFEALRSVGAAMKAQGEGT